MNGSLIFTIFKQYEILSTNQSNDLEPIDHNTSQYTCGNFKLCSPRDSFLENGPPLESSGNSGHYCGKFLLELRSSPWSTNNIFDNLLSTISGCGSPRPIFWSFAIRGPISQEVKSKDQKIGRGPLDWPQRKSRWIDIPAIFEWSSPRSAVPFVLRVTLLFRTLTKTGN